MFPTDKFLVLHPKTAIIAYLEPFTLQADTREGSTVTWRSCKRTESSENIVKYNVKH